MDTWLFGLHVVGILMLSSLVLLAGITQRDSAIWGTHCLYS